MTIGAALYTFDDLPDRLRNPAANVDCLSTSDRSLAASSRGANAAFANRRRRREGVSCGRRTRAIEAGGRAAEVCLALQRGAQADLGLLIYTGVYRDEYLSEPAAAAIVAGRIDLNAGAADEERKAIASIL